MGSENFTGVCESGSEKVAAIMWDGGTFRNCCALIPKALAPLGYAGGASSCFLDDQQLFTVSLLGNPLYCFCSTCPRNVIPKCHIPNVIPNVITRNFLWGFCGYVSLEHFTGFFISQMSFPNVTFPNVIPKCHIPKCHIPKCHYQQLFTGVWWLCLLFGSVLPSTFYGVF